MRSHNASKMSYFVYSGDELLKFLHTAQRSLAAFINDPQSNHHSITGFIDVLLSYHMKRGVSSISILTLISYFELGREFKKQQDSMRNLQDKMAVVKKLFDDSSPSMTPNPVHESNENVAVKYSTPQTITSPNPSNPIHSSNVINAQHRGPPPPSSRSPHSFPPPQHNNGHHHHHSRPPMTTQKVRRRFPIQNVPPPKHEALSIRHPLSPKRPHPMDKSKSHPTPSSPTKGTKMGSSPNGLSKSDHSDAERDADEFAEHYNNGETTPVLSDIEDIDHHLAAVVHQGSNAKSSVNDRNRGYDSDDVQSEMSATPQPTDMTNTVIPSFMPNGNGNGGVPGVSEMDNVMQQIEELPAPPNRQRTNGMDESPPPLQNTLHGLQIVDLPSPPPKIKTMQSDMTEISHDADDELEVSSAGSSGISSADNDAVGGGDSSGFKKIKTMTPTPHSRCSQIIVYSDGVDNGQNEEEDRETAAVVVPKRRASRRQSQTEIAVMEQIDIRYEAKSEFTMIEPINQQQGVDNLIRSSRNSLGQNALKDTVEQLRKEYEAHIASSDSENDEGQIVDVQQMSDTASGKEEEDDFLDDEDVAAMRTKYVSMTSVTESTLPLQSHSAHSPGVPDENKSSRSIPKRFPLRGTKSMSHQMERSGNSHTDSRRSHRSERQSESELTSPAMSRQMTNETTQSHRSGSSVVKKQSVSFYQHSNSSTKQSKNRPIVSVVAVEEDNNSSFQQRRAHSRSTSDFVRSSHGKRASKTSANASRSNQFMGYERHQEDSEDRMSALSDIGGGNNSMSNGNGTKNRARKYAGKRSNDEQRQNTVSVSNSNPNSNLISNPNANRTVKAKRKKKAKRTIMASKSERIRQNYIVRAKYVDSHRAMGKYALDRNKSWRKWIQLLQSHDNDIANVTATEQVQALIDFARMSLGNYGNWLYMKSGTANMNGNDIVSDSQSASSQWTLYFAVMRDFNIFLFDHRHFPSTLEEVVSSEYNALSLAHIESVAQCSSTPTELYLEVAGSEMNHCLKFRCESVESCKQWVAEINYQIHIVSDLCCNQALRLECADQKRSVWIPVAPPYVSMMSKPPNAANASIGGEVNSTNISLSAVSKRHRSKSARKLYTRSDSAL